MNPLITSAHNPTIKQLRKLITSGKVRRETGVYVAEGSHLINSYLKTGGVPLNYICAKSALTNPEVISLIKQLDSLEVKAITVTDSLFATIATIHAAVGVIITLKPQKEVVQKSESMIILEDIQDPGNLGTILRTAAAAGVRNAVLSTGCASPWSPKALRAGMGAQFGLRIQEESDLSLLIDNLSIPIMVTTLSNKSKNLYELDLTQPLAWVFGSEGRGVSQPLVELATTHVRIPQDQTAIESLNVAAAASICLYEHYRQTHH